MCYFNKNIVDEVYKVLRIDLSLEDKMSGK